MNKSEKSIFTNKLQATNEKNKYCQTTIWICHVNQRYLTSSAFSVPVSFPLVALLFFVLLLADLVGSCE
jgi:hypothetical protein